MECTVAVAAAAGVVRIAAADAAGLAEGVPAGGFAEMAGQSMLSKR